MDLLNVEVTASDEEADNDDGIQRLVEGLNISDLSTAGTEFSVQINEDNALEEQRTYEGENVFPHLNLHCLGSDESEDTPADGDTPFAALALKMTNIAENGKVKKRILREGYGEMIPPEALVWFHYNSYLEFHDTPFDSSYLRGPMTMIRLNSGKCILGLEIGLPTMKLGEKAEFLIHHDYAYGKLGVDPRIPPEAEILMHVEMKKFVDNAQALKMGELNEDELKSMPFAEICKGALSLLHEGKSAVAQKKIPLALKWYRNALRSLENCDMKSDDDELKNEALRLKLYTNMAVCYNKLNRSKQAIVACRSALQINPNQTKVLYHLGLAHLNLSSFDEAKKFAFKARKLAPGNVEVSKLLQKIDSKMERYNVSAVSFAKNAFKFLDNNSEKANQEKHINQNENEDKMCMEKNECSGGISSEFSGGVKITEITENNDKISPQVTAKQERYKENLVPAEMCPEAQCEAGFQLETIDYIQEFVDDPTERQLPLPLGLTYEEEMFFKKQSMLYGLRWEERQEEGKVLVYLLK